MKHKLLVNLGRKWLKKYCYIVVTEMAGACSEEPDVFGWSSRGSYLIECKTSRSDFYADKKKHHRKYSAGLGDYRYYLAPKGLLKVEEIPKGWGLLESTKSKVRMKARSKGFTTKALGWELSMALSLIRRIGQKPVEGCSIKAYSYQTKCRASVGISLNQHYEKR